MSWGNIGVANASNGPAVFDTAFGYAGMWHLDDSATAYGTANAFSDATVHRAFGANFLNAVDQTGIVGLGHNFNGADYILVSKQVISMASSDFSLALWINLRREWCTIFSKDTAIAQDSCARRLYCGDAPGDSSGLHLSFGGKGCGTAVSAAALTLNAMAPCRIHLERVVGHRRRSLLTARKPAWRSTALFRVVRTIRGTGSFSDTTISTFSGTLTK